MTPTRRPCWPRAWRFALALGLIFCIHLPRADAFCGFYVGSASTRLENKATMVVLMRSGTKTVLSMQNDYEGPPEDFSLVIPVPEVLSREDVRTLPRDVFDRVDRLAAPRLVEYEEQDPCRRVHTSRMSAASVGSIDALLGSVPTRRSIGSTVQVLARFEVGEYDIHILSASDSLGLEGWLRENGYNLPAGTAAALRPYIQSGTKFFVARVDTARVQFRGGRAILSPLRFHFDSDRFSLPIRLGLLNSSGAQDLVVHILGRDVRYHAANYPNVPIPTNLRVERREAENFSRYYERLLRRTWQRHPGAVITEYAWQSGNCDPCPGPALDANTLATLGGDLVGVSHPSAWVLTRLHARYDVQNAGDDLVFASATAISGGRGVPDARGRVSSAREFGGSINQFQARYIRLRRYAGSITCADPQRGVWGMPRARGVRRNLRAEAGPAQPSSNEPIEPDEPDEPNEPNESDTVASAVHALDQGKFRTNVRETPIVRAASAPAYPYLGLALCATALLLLAYRPRE